jgi:hypothetical protein
VQAISSHYLEPKLDKAYPFQCRDGVIHAAMNSSTDWVACHRYADGGSKGLGDRST